MEEKDTNSEAYKQGWVVGYCDGRDDKVNISPDECIQYYYGFEDGYKAYSNEITKI